MADHPRRIQRKRTKGWRMARGAIYVGRGSKWGNPFEVGCIGGLWFAAGNARSNWHWSGPFYAREDAAEAACLLYDRHVIPGGGLNALEELRGHDLCCWCGLDESCHADILLDLANIPHTDGNNGKDFDGQTTGS